MVGTTLADAPTEGTLDRFATVDEVARVVEVAAVFPPQRSPSPVALDLVQVVRQALDELSPLPIYP
jgi:hypothetical protein